MEYRWMLVVAALGATAIAIGAFGAHWLPHLLAAQNLDAQTLQHRSNTLETGVRYHFYHVLAILACSAMQACRPNSGQWAARWAFLVGILVFSGLLYVIALTGQSKLGALVPLGGIAFIVGWISLGIGAFGGVRTTH